MKVYYGVDAPSCRVSDADSGRVMGVGKRGYSPLDRRGLETASTGAFALTILLLLLCIACKRTPPTAESIIERMKTAYATCHTYEEDGERTLTVSIPSPRGDGSTLSTNSATFRIRFRRPDLWYEFPHRETPNPMTPDAFRNRTNWPVNMLVLRSLDQKTLLISQKYDTYWHSQSLSNALHESVMLGGGGSAVLALLTQNQSGMIELIQGPQLIGEDKVDGVRCYVIAAKLAQAHGLQQFWVGKRDFMLRKTSWMIITQVTHPNPRKRIAIPSHLQPKPVTEIKVPMTNVVEEVHRKVRVNKAIAGDAFGVLFPATAREVTNVVALMPDVESARMRKSASEK